MFRGLRQPWLVLLLLRSWPFANATCCRGVECGGEPSGRQPLGRWGNPPVGIERVRHEAREALEGDAEALAARSRRGPCVLRLPRERGRNLHGRAMRRMGHGRRITRWRLCIAESTSMLVMRARVRVGFGMGGRWLAACTIGG